MKIELSPELTKIALEIGATHYDVVWCEFIKKVEDRYAYYSSTHPVGKWVCGISSIDGVLEIDFTQPKAELLAEIERLKAALDKQWQPIESAPKDGTHVLVLLKSGSVMQAEFWDFWMPVYFSATKIEPTHWMPLPPTP